MSLDLTLAIKIAVTGYALLIVSLFTFSILTDLFVKLMRRLDNSVSKREDQENESE